MQVPIILVCSLAIIILIVMHTYNKLIQFRNTYKNAFTQIDVQLKRRYDLIPNLVNTAKGYMKHEMETLERVISARNMALHAQQKIQGNPEKRESLTQLVKAENELGGLLSKLIALSENYPDLKANENMLHLQEELGSTENKIAFARQFFNDSVTSYNNAREIFPNNIVARFFDFKPAELWELDQETREKRVDVNF